jgi:hypothetical protein
LVVDSDSISYLFLVFAFLFGLMLCAAAWQTYLLLRPSHAMDGVSWIVQPVYQLTNRRILIEHALVCVMCVFRVVTCASYYAAQFKEQREKLNMEMVTIVSGLPYIVMLWLFALLGEHWASLFFSHRDFGVYLASVKRRYEVVKPFFHLAIGASSAILFLFFCFIAFSNDTESRERHLLVGSTLCAIMIIGLSLMFTAAAAVMHRNTARDWKSTYAETVYRLGICFCICFVGGAFVWLVSGVAPQAFVDKFDVANAFLFVLDLVALACVLATALRLISKRVAEATTPSYRAAKYGDKLKTPKMTPEWAVVKRGAEQNNARKLRAAAAFDSQWSLARPCTTSTLKTRGLVHRRAMKTIKGVKESAPGNDDPDGDILREYEEPKKEKNYGRRHSSSSTLSTSSAESTLNASSLPTVKMQKMPFSLAWLYDDSMSQSLASVNTSSTFDASNADGWDDDAGDWGMDVPVPAVSPRTMESGVRALRPSSVSMPKIPSWLGGNSNEPALSNDDGAVEPVPHKMPDWLRTPSNSDSNDDNTDGGFETARPAQLGNFALWFENDDEERFEFNSSQKSDSKSSVESSDDGLDFLRSDQVTPADRDDVESVDHDIGFTFNTNDQTIFFDDENGR